MVQPSLSNELHQLHNLLARRGKRVKYLFDAGFPPSFLCFLISLIPRQRLAPSRKSCSIFIREIASIVRHTGCDTRFGWHQLRMVSRKHDRLPYDHVDGARQFPGYAHVR